MPPDHCRTQEFGTRQNTRHQLAFNVGHTEVSTTVSEGQAFLVLTQQTQNCGMQIVDLANAKESQRTGKLTHAARRGFQKNCKLQSHRHAAFGHVAFRFFNRVSAVMKNARSECRAGTSGRDGLIQVLRRSGAAAGDDGN